MFSIYDHVQVVSAHFHSEVERCYGMILDDSAEFIARLRYFRSLCNCNILIDFADWPLTKEFFDDLVHTRMNEVPPMRMMSSMSVLSKPVLMRISFPLACQINLAIDLLKCVESDLFAEVNTGI